MRKSPFQEDIQTIVLKEINLFLARPGIKPSHRIYALGFLNKAASIMVSAGNMEARSVILRTYFNLFNELLHQDPVAQNANAEPKKKDRSISKKERIKKEKEARKKRGEVDEEDNKAVELVLKGVNIVIQKSPSKMDQDLKVLLEKQTNLLFKLTHHGVFRI